MLRGIDIVEVASGTEIEGPDGKKLTVTDTEAVTKGRKIYCTARVVAALREKTTPV